MPTVVAHPRSLLTATAPESDSAAGPSLAEAVVDLGAIEHNVATICKATTAEVLAVVKADGFGHGAVEVARTALAAGASWLGVTSLDEAQRLRTAGIDAPMLAWLYLPSDDLGSAVDASVDLSVSTPEQLAAVAQAARSVRTTAQVHLKADTGMHRAGAGPDRWPSLVRHAARLEATGVLRVRGLWSHLARADEPDSPLTTLQCALFDRAVEVARATGLLPDVLHLANSAAVLSAPRTHYSLVRAGIAIYGVEPIQGRRHGLIPAMTLQTRVLQAGPLTAGSGVSYGHDYVADTDTSIALVPAGFADGVPRAASGRAQVLVGGMRAPVAGRIAMDQFVVDTGSHPARTGDPVILFGPGGRGEPSVTDWARWAGTNEHEILTGVGDRVARRYIAADGNSGVHRTRVAVIFGGTSAEHEVSCESGSAVVAALDADRYDVISVFVATDGTWTVGGATPYPVVRGTLADAVAALRSADVAFPVLHGPMGEDGTLQGMLSTLGVPHVGSGVLASAIGMDKAVTKDLLRAHGIDVSEGVVLERASDGVPAEERGRLGLPVVVKPARAGSSQGVTRVDDWADLDAALDTARTFDPKVLVERCSVGLEVDVAVLQHADGRLEAGPPLEITYASGHQLFDYEAKYADHDGTRFVIPARLDGAMAAQLQALALRAFQALGCAGLLRVDFLLPTSGRPLLNEVNTMPGFTAMSQFPQIWAADGRSYADVLDTLIETAMAGTSLTRP